MRRPLHPLRDLIPQLDLPTQHQRLARLPELGEPVQVFKGREAIDLQGFDNNQIQVFGHIGRGAVDGANVADRDDVPVVLELAECDVQGLTADEVKIRIKALRGEAGELGTGILGLVVKGSVEVEVIEQEADLEV